MISLLTVNIEGTRHYDRIVELITSKQPDIICLQELPSAFVGKLAELGYFTTYAPMLVGNKLAPGDCIGVGIATKKPSTAQVFYYAGNTGNMVPYQREGGNETISNPVIFCTYEMPDGATYCIATAHQPVTVDGTADVAQNIATTNLLTLLATQPAHLLCGDMNMPRGYNTNYERFCAQYTDEIPTHYTSSLDRTLHRLGTKNDLNAPIFDIYMVDYIFSQSSYKVENVELVFGVSDHAAVTATISRV